MRLTKELRDTLGLEQIADWSSHSGHAILLDAGHTTLELFDEAQATNVDQVEAGHRVSGPVRLALQVADLDTVTSSLVQAGAVPVAPAVDTPWGDRNAHFQTADGLQLGDNPQLRLPGTV
jgi:uncharacterized glyoxalase superfamily protein PhnB